AVFHAPQDTLRLVAADTEVGRLERLKILVEDGLAAFGTSPAVRDGITHEQDVDVALLGDFQEALVTLRLERRGDDSRVLLFLLASLLCWLGLLVLSRSRGDVEQKSHVQDRESDQ